MIPYVQDHIPDLYTKHSGFKKGDLLQIRSKDELRQQFRKNVDYYVDDLFFCKMFTEPGEVISFSVSEENNNIFLYLGYKLWGNPREPGADHYFLYGHTIYKTSFTTYELNQFNGIYYSFDLTKRFKHAKKALYPLKR